MSFRTVALSSRAAPSWPASLKPTAMRTFRPSRPKERSAMSELALKLSTEELLQLDEFGELRQRARRALMQHGFPDLKTEEWKYTSLRVLQQREFQAASASASQLPGLPFDACVLHFDNGVLDPDSVELIDGIALEPAGPEDRKSTRLNSSHVAISCAVFCLKKKNKKTPAAQLHILSEEA